MDNNTYKTALLVLLFTNSVMAGDEWMMWPSTYTHDMNSQRVDQYAQPVEPLAQRRADFQRSGYRNYRSTLQTGNSADNINIVEQWGAPVEPYEAWRFPFRPYGSPYQAWGPPTPYGIFNGNLGAGFYPGQAQATPHPGGQYPGGQYPGGQHPGGQHPGGQRPGGGLYPGQYPGGQHPGGNYPGGGHYPGGNYPAGPNAGGVANPSNGFPLTAPYESQPWYDGTYPTAPPLDASPDRDFFYKPRQ